jgi:hypothetical protein
MSQDPPRTWRDVITVHPAADLFPLMGKDELRELADDIKANGVQTQIVFWDSGNKRPLLLDGRNRLDALELAGLLIIDEDFIWLRRPDGTKRYVHARYIESTISESDPYALAVSLNIQRRHLTGEQRHDLIAKLVKAAPEKSDRQIADQTKASPSTVGKVRKELEQTGDVSKLDTRTDTKGRQQPASKPKAAQPASNQQICDEVASRMASALNSLNDRPASKPKSETNTKPKSRIAAAKETVDVSTIKLREFEFACRTYLPRLNEADLQKASVYFNGQAWSPTSANWRPN